MIKKKDILQPEDKPQTEEYAYPLYRNLFDAIPDGLVVLKTDGRIQAANRTFCLLLGSKEKDLLGRRLEECVIFKDITEERIVHIPSTEEIGRMRHTFFIPRVRIYNECELLGLAEIEGLVLRQNEAELPYATVLCIWAPGVLSKESMPLFYKWRFHAIAQLAASFTADVAALSSSMESHLLTVGEQLLPKSYGHRQNRVILESLKQTKTMTGQIGTLLALSKDETRTNIRRIDLHPVLRDAAEQALSGTSSRKIKLRIAPIRARYVMARSEELRTCVQSIIRNAIEALNGEGEIRIDTSLSTIGERSFGVIRIRDSGYGILPDVSPHIFEPFFTTKDRTENAGLGLSLAQAVLQSWGGFIRFRSRPEAGSSFRMFLPVAEFPQEDATERQITVLTIDDDTAFLSDTAFMLKRCGYASLTCSTADEAIRLLEQRQKALPDIILLDTVMATQGTERVVQCLAEMPSHPFLIMISGFSRDYARTLVKGLAWSFLQKPFDEPTLLKAIKKTLSSSPGIPRGNVKK